MQAAALPSPIIAVPNVTAHTSTASVPITVLLYDGPLLCGFNVAIEGLIFPFIQTNMTSQMWPSGGKRGAGSELKSITVQKAVSGRKQ